MAAACKSTLRRLWDAALVFGGAPRSPVGLIEIVERRFPGQRPTSVTASKFFVAALVLVAVAAAINGWYYHRTTNVIALGAGALAVMSLLCTPIVRTSAKPYPIGRGLDAPGMEAWCTLAVLVAFLAFYGSTAFPESPYNEQVRQAVAFLKGHTYIDAPNTFLEHAQVGPYSYALHPPLPAILLMPIVAIWGMDANQTLFSLVLGAIGVALVWHMLGRLRLNVNARVWLTIFFGAGTVFWYETALGTTWALPIITATLFEVAALSELLGPARPLWMGLYLALACLARYEVALAVPIFIITMWLKGRRIGEMFWIAPSFLLAGAFVVAFNEARFESFFDVGLWHIPNVKVDPVFSLRYLPGNLYTVFFMAPTINGDFPYLHPIFAGQALTLTSPAFVLALRARLGKFLALSMLLCAIAVSVPSLLCYANGFAQFGTRHYIPAFPYLIVMMALGMGHRADRLARILIGASIVLVAFGVWHVHIWGLS